MCKQSDQLDKLSDIKLIERIQDGESNLFAELIYRYQAYALTIIKRHVPHHLFEDTAQDAFFRMYKSLDSYRPTGPFKMWLNRVVVRTCYDTMRVYYRSEEKTAPAENNNQQLWFDQLRADEADEHHEQFSQKKEAREILDLALDRLSPAERIVLELVHLEGYTGREAARLLGWSLPNIKIRAHRARKKIRKFLEVHMDQGGKPYETIS